MPMIDPIVQIVLAAALVLLFAAACRHKLLAQERFRAQLRAYRLLPDVLVVPVAGFLAAGEAALAVALLIPGPRPAAAVAAALLLSGYGAAMAINLARGRDRIDCGCGDAPQPLSSALVLRNGVLAAAALVVALPAAERSLTGIDLLFAALGLMTLVIAHQAAEQLLRNAALLEPWRRSSD